jgi:hypothetical protein
MTTSNSISVNANRRERRGEDGLVDIWAITRSSGNKQQIERTRNSRRTATKSRTLADRLRAVVSSR